MIFYIVFFAFAFNVLAQEGNGQLIIKLSRTAFEQTSSRPNGRRVSVPAIAGATEAHWLVADENLGPKAKAAGFDRVVVADFSALPELRGSKANQRSSVAIAQKYFASGVEVVEENISAITLNQYEVSLPFPDDPFVEKQWHLDSTGVKALWKQSAPAFVAGGVKVVVIDSGVSPVPDLAQNLDMFNSKSFVGGGSPNDDPSTTGMMTPYPYGHGTIVAGVAGAVGNNGQGIAGIDWAMSLVSYRIFSPISIGGGSTTLTTSYEKILKAFVALLDLPAERLVVNCSFSYPADSQNARLWGEAIQALGERGLVVAAAGNNGSTTAQYPCALGLPNVVCAGSAGRDGKLSGFSNRGEWVDIVAPGEGIFSTANDGTYQPADGTSFAVPMVSGVADLLWKAEPTLTASQMKEVILNGAGYNPFLEGLIARPRQLSLAGSLSAVSRLMTTGSSKILDQVRVEAITPVWTDEPGISWWGIATIWGSGFTDGMTFTAPVGEPLPTQLGGISVKLSQSPFPARLLYVGPEQINVVFSMDNFRFPSVTSKISVVKYDNQGNAVAGATLKEGVKPVAWNPGIYTRDGVLFTQKHGDRTLVYAAGLGVTNPIIRDGNIWPAGTESVLAKIEVFIDGQPIDFRATASALSAGLYEISWPTRSAQVVTVRVSDENKWWEKTFIAPEQKGSGQ